MITYSKIGLFGRLGNQMFQFAGTYGIARKLNYDVTFPMENMIEGQYEEFKDGVTRYCTFDLPKVFTLKKDILRPKENIFPSLEYEVQEPHFHFNEQFFSIPDNADLKGYYQTEKYFEHVKEEILELFTFKLDIQSEANKLFPKLTTETVSIHLRIGDYKGLENFHPICSPEYYSNAIKLFSDKEYHFIIFSDDVNYCKELFGEQENIHYINNVDPYIDMCLMSMCNHNIIANSSFSWWAAYLNKNKNKLVVAPKQWFGPAYYFHDTNDLYCKEWIVI